MKITWRGVVGGVLGLLMGLIVGSLIFNRADAAEPVVTPIDSCLDGWFWKAGSGEKETPQSLTPDGLFFNDQDTTNAVIAWHFAEATPADAQVFGPKWSMVDFATAGPGSPGPNTAFKFLTSPWTGTWNYQGDGLWWTTGGSGLPSTTYTNEQMVESLGNLDATVGAFGIGTETISVDQPGFIVERVFFAGEAYSLVCEPEIVVSTVPGPVVTVVKTVTVTPTVTATPEVSVSTTKASVLTVPNPPTTTQASSSSPAGDEFPWMAVVGGVALAAGAAATAAAVAKRRREREDPYYDADHTEDPRELESANEGVDIADTQVIPYVDNGDGSTEELPRQE